MTYVTFSFDTEDYVNPHAADGILRSAMLLKQYEIKGCYNVVGWLAKALTEWGRQDIIDALRHHDITPHSLSHSHHPTINEYTDLEDFEEAKRAFLKQETECLQILSQYWSGKTISAACPPGNSTSYVAHYGYAELGIPFYDGDNLCDQNRGRPVTCCNIGCLDYTVCLEEVLRSHTKEQLVNLLDRLANEKDYAILYNHPQKLIIDEFWDGKNFNGKNTPKEQWILSPAMSEEQQVNQLFLGMAA